MKLYSSDNDICQTKIGTVFLNVWQKVINECLREFLYMT